MIYIINYNNRLLDLLSPYVFSEVKIVKKNLWREEWDR